MRQKVKDRTGRNQSTDRARSYIVTINHGQSGYWGRMQVDAFSPGGAAREAWATFRHRQTGCPDIASNPQIMKGKQVVVVLECDRTQVKSFEFQIKSGKVALIAA